MAPAALMPAQKVTPYAPRAIVYTGQPASFYRVNVGVVRVIRNGRHVDFYGPGDYFGEGCMASGSSREQAVAMTDCTLNCWPRGELYALLEDDQRADAFTAFLLSRIEREREKAAVLNGKLMPARIAAFLLDTAERVGVDGVIGFPLTHQLISEIVDTSREWVTSTMNAFRREGWVEFDRFRVTVKADRLREFTQV